MNPASTPRDEWLSLPAEERAETFQAKPLWQRFLIVAAGPADQLPVRDLAFMIAMFASYRLSDARPPIDRRGRRGTAPPQRPASGRATGSSRSTAARSRRFEDMQPVCRASAGAADALRRRARQSRRSSCRRRPRARCERDQFGNEARIGRIGIAARRRLEVRAGCRSHRAAGRRRPARRSTRSQTMVAALGQVITGRRSLKELGGPLKIAEVLRPAGEPRLARLLLADDRDLN